MKKKWSIRTFWQQSKASIIIIVLAALLVELVAQTRYWHAHRIVRESAEQRAISDLRIKSMELNIVMTGVQTILNDYAIDLWRSYTKPNSPDSLHYLMGQLVCNYPQVSGAYCMFEPNYFSSQGSRFEPFFVQEATIEDHVNYNIGTIGEDYTSQDRYVMPMRTDSAYWSEPYFDEEGRHTMAISCSVPVHDHSGRRVGVIGTNISLKGLTETLYGQYIYPSSFFVLLNSSGHYLAGKEPLDDEVREEIRENAQGIDWYENAKGEEKVVFFRKVEGPTGWKIAIVCSKDEIYNDLVKADIQLIGIGLLGFILLVFIILRLMRNLKSLMEVTNERQRINSELHVAGEIQNSMIPKTFPAFPDRQDIDIHATLLPAKAVGGDLYEYLIRDEKLFFCIGDVSGKGIPAALFMTAACSMFHLVSAHRSSPEQIVASINESLFEINKTNLFVTLFVGVLDLPTGRLRYCNAGHNPPLLNGKPLPVLANFPMGLMDDWKYQPQEVMLAPKSMLFLYTDGLTEAMNERHELYGEQRMYEDIASIEHASPRLLIEHMNTAVHRFVKDYEQSDDLTMLALRYTPQKEQHVLLQHSITLGNRIGELERMTSFVKEVMDEIGMEKALAAKVRLAVEEAVTNVIQYAYSSTQEGDVILCIKATWDHLEIVIRDNGVPFDPTENPTVDTSAPEEERRVGGLGIHFMRQLMDTINYERIEGSNVLTMRKKIEVRKP